MKTLFRLSASMAFALTMGGVCLGQHYVQTNLVSTTAGVARVTDTQLVNPWGMSRSSSSAWWISDQRTGFSTVYNGAGVKQSLLVTIPPADPTDKNTPTGTPTGTVFNGSQTDFLLAPGKPAVFLFSTIDGTIAGWNPAVGVAQGSALPSTHAVTMVKTSDGSSYTGLTSAFIDGRRYLYAANFAKGRVDVYDGAFNPVRLSDRDWSDDNSYYSEDSFVDGRLPRPYAPFNVQAIGNDIVVTYAIHQQEVSPLETDGPGLGFVDIYDSKGHLLLRLEHGDWLNAPWGVALTPGDFGRFSANLLIGQFAGGGDTQSSGYIAAYRLTTGKFNGLLQDANGKPLVIKGIWALNPGNVSPNNNDYPAGTTSRVYFTAGPNHGSGGLFGYLAAVSAEDGVEEASLSSSEPATDMQMDGAYVGTTPLDIDLPCCFHDVTISRPGLKPWTGRVRNNGHANISSQLQK
ncbi:MAG TPA: TIGR03118 family protein [Candidatus Acidoferrum sp.]|nr:TIGR03118 family protein [Candidatus Acidoferrum sp.]